MNKKIIKYTSRIVLGLFTLFWGLVTWAALTPTEGYHHCEAGQEDWSPLTCALITIVSLITFCFVWYKTKDKTIIDSDVSSLSENLPEPYKSFADFEKYISELKWIGIENEEQIVSMSGLYLFKCRGDNHTFFESHELEKGDKLCKHYLDHHPDGWAIVKPIGYHYVENDKKTFVIEGLNRI